MKAKRLKILLSNLGYARGIDGRISHHARYWHRHLYCPAAVQKHTLHQLNALIAQEDPDVCCFVEIDRGSFTSAGFNQITALYSANYPQIHLENKYGPDSPLRSFFLTRGKSNGFMSRPQRPFETLYFDQGIKRLIQKITLAPELSLFFTHLSLNRATRREQLIEMAEILRNTPGESVLMGDFNVLLGFKELHPLLEQTGLVLLNEAHIPTFRFHRRSLVLDLCLCTAQVAQRSQLKIVPQPYSDHAALILEIQADS